MVNWKTVLLDQKQLENVKSLLNQGDPQILECGRKLKLIAEKSLSAGPFTVMNKTFVPPSGDKHDYVSMGPYWWPNPDSPDGLPYIRRDGVRNPEIEQFDAPALKKLEDHVRKLTLAYYFLDDERYARHAIHLLRTWYVDPQTRMNPNLNFGQMIPGICPGRGIGLIETRHFGHLMDNISLLTASKAWNTELSTSLYAWFEEYLHWLLHSSIALDEEQWHNNHGTYYDVQTASLALHIGDMATARRILNLVPERRYFKHIEPDGKQPHELERTLSLSYSLMNLIGLFDLARLGETAGLDLWHVQSFDGRSLRAAVDFLEPFCAGHVEWPYEQIKLVDTDRTFGLFRRAANVYGDHRYERIAAQVSEQGDNYILELINPSTAS